VADPAGVTRRRETSMNVSTLNSVTSFGEPTRTEQA
jgi:hypothetical protein